MRTSALWLFILWQVFWLNIFIPGHTRGAYGTLGEDSCCAPKQVETQASSCCSTKTHHTPQDDQPTPDQQRRCAVCYFAAGYSVPEVFVFDVGLLGQVAKWIETTTPQIVVLAFDFPFYPVGPPIG